VFDPKEIYGKISMREVIGDAPIKWSLELKDWPCDELAVITLENKHGTKECTIIAPGCTVEGTLDSLRSSITRLKKEAARSGF